MDINQFIELALEEDIGKADYTTLACIDKNVIGRASLIIKENGVIAGVDVAKKIFEYVNPQIKYKPFVKDGQSVFKGDIGFEVEGHEHYILKAERIVLNIMQRMSGIATETSKYVQKLNGLKTKVLDTRKTTPLFRMFEKLAVRIGGGMNHRMGLYDMIMIKDNHIDYAGSIEIAIDKTKRYLEQSGLNLKIEIETRNLSEVQQVLSKGGVNRIMLDNFDLQTLKEAIKLINKQYETESSGGINLETIRSYAETGVDFISVGSITNSYRTLDLSLKAR
jgi:nicotinate-nucleotide pyrophosphorylase (carboxylating)